MKIAICDDDREELKRVEEYCNSFGYADLICCSYADSSELLREIVEDRSFADLYILDIDMPRPNGIEIKEVLSEKGFNVSIVFLTNHAEMMEEAFGRNVIAFIQKNNWKPRMGIELSKLHEKLKSVIIVHGDTGELTIPIRDIISISACNYYSQICYWVRQGNTEVQGTEKHLLIKKSLRKWEKEGLPFGFYRISRSAILNFANTERYHGEQIRMLNGDEYTLPKGSVKKFKSAYFEYLETQKRYL